jgi:hypothetical protein
MILWLSLVSVALACADDDDDNNDAADDDDDDDDNDDNDNDDNDNNDDTESPRLIGRWSGDALVPDGEFLLPGEFPVDFFVMMAGSQVRGFFDLHQNVAILAEAFAYYFTGEANDEMIALTFTDRLCGAGDPPGLCYPMLPALPEVFAATGQAAVESILFDQAEELPAIGYDTDLPFTTMTLTRDDEPGSDDGVPFAGDWDGWCRIPTSVVYPLPLPLYGANSMEIAEDPPGTYQIVRFDNEYLGNVIPTWDDEILLADSLLCDEATQRLAFIQLGTTYASWLYVGVQRGSQLTMLVTFNPLDAPYYDYWTGQTEPPDPTAIAVLDLVGVCTFDAVER